MRAVRVILVLGLVSLTSCKLDSDPIDYDCSVFPPSESSSYILPWMPGRTYKANPHAARETSVQRYAIDVAMPIGTIVIAIQAGDVVRIQEELMSMATMHQGMRIMCSWSTATEQLLDISTLQIEAQCLD